MRGVAASGLAGGGAVRSAASQRSVPLRARELSPACSAGWRCGHGVG